MRVAHRTQYSLEAAIGHGLGATIPAAFIIDTPGPYFTTPRRAASRRFFASATPDTPATRPRRGNPGGALTSPASFRPSPSSSSSSLRCFMVSLSTASASSCRHENEKTKPAPETKRTDITIGYGMYIRVGECSCETKTPQKQTCRQRVRRHDRQRCVLHPPLPGAKGGEESHRRPKKIKNEVARGERTASCQLKYACATLGYFRVLTTKRLAS